MKKLLLIVAAALLATGCLTTGGAAPKKAEKQVYIIECEDFTLENADVMDNPDGLGGKGIMIKGEGSNASFSTDTIAPGVYTVEVFVNCADGDSDGFYIALNGGEEQRMYANTGYGSTVYANQQAMKKVEAGAFTIDIIGAEPVFFDHIRFTPK